MTDPANQPPGRAVGEGERLYRILAEHSSDVIAVFDLQSRPLYVSPSVFQLRGYTPEECLAQTSEERLTPRSQEVVRQALAEVLAVERAGETPPNSYRRLELEQPCKDGSTVWVESTFTWIRDEAGKPTGVLSMTRDITARRRAEAALAESQLQLRESQKLEAVGRLAGGVAHEFNNLMTVVPGARSGCSPSTVENATLRPAARDDRAGRPARRAPHRAAHGLLPAPVPRPGGGGRERDVRAITPALRRLLPAPIELTTRLPEGLPAVEADRLQLEHVLHQLVMNARDAMPDGGRVILETSATGREGGPRTVVLSVADTGIGMSEEVRDHAFEPFFTTKDIGAGSGLGLAMVYGAVQQHGGRVEMDSVPGVGTTVRIHLPALAPAAPALPPRATVLVVERDSATAERLAEVLGSGGYRVLPARGGEQALEVAARHPGPIDLLITEVILGRPQRRASYPRASGGPRAGLRTLFVIEGAGELDRGCPARVRLAGRPPAILGRPPREGRPRAAAATS